MNLNIMYFIGKCRCDMGKSKKTGYHFWQWLIMQIVRIPKLYVLAWGIVILLIIACLKTELAVLLSGILS